VKRIQIYDALGRLQQTVFPNNIGQIEIETSNWAIGVYGVLIEQEANVTQLKVVKSSR
jgi:hypothetical protein